MIDEPGVVGGIRQYLLAPQRNSLWLKQRPDGLSRPRSTNGTSECGTYSLSPIFGVVGHFWFCRWKGRNSWQLPSARGASRSWRFRRLLNVCSDAVRARQVRQYGEFSEKNYVPDPQRLARVLSRWHGADSREITLDKQPFRDSATISSPSGLVPNSCKNGGSFGRGRCG